MFVDACDRAENPVSILLRVSSKRTGFEIYQKGNDQTNIRSTKIHQQRILVSKSTRLMLLPFCTGRQWMREDGKIMAQHTKRPKMIRRWEAFLLFWEKIRIQNPEKTSWKDLGQKSMWKKHTHTKCRQKREQCCALDVLLHQKDVYGEQEMFYCWCPVSEESEVGFVALLFYSYCLLLPVCSGVEYNYLDSWKKNVVGQRWRHLSILKGSFAAWE